VKLLGLIPARGGSKRLPNKNLADLGGKSLLAWTIEAAKASFLLNLIAVSTNDMMIGMEATALGCIVINRPDDLAQADTPTLPVIQHALSVFPRFDAVMLLQPTSPLRTAKDIQRALTWLGQHDSLVSVGPDGQPNGAIYITRVKTLMDGGPIYCAESRIFAMPSARSVDIDTQADLDLARRFVDKGIYA
jgi:N-acylneuraminate cytidylyltransferase